jgi:hypothetical protein
MLARALNPGAIPFLGQLLDRLLVLRRGAKSHAAQHVRRLGELDVGVADDLDSIAPRIQKSRNGPGRVVIPRVGQRLADDLLVIDDEAESDGRRRAAACGLSAAR